MYFISYSIIRTRKWTIFIFLFSIFQFGFANKEISLQEALGMFMFQSKGAQTAKLEYENTILEFRNYQKSFLPTLSLNFSPFFFNHSMRLLQSAIDGNYSNIEDYTNSSNLGLSIMVPIFYTGGKLTFNSNLSALREFSRNRNSFSSTPINISYGQSLFGGYQQNKLTRQIENYKYQLATMTYCLDISELQQQILSIYLSVYLNQQEESLTKKDYEISDTLLSLAKNKFKCGLLTDYDVKKIEYQQLEAHYNYEQACHNKENFLLQLKTILGISDLIDVQPPDSSLLPSFLSQDEVLILIRQNNPYYTSKQLRLEEGKLKLHQSLQETRFNGNFSINYGMNQYADHLIGAYQHPNSCQSINLSFDFPIFQWGINHNKRTISRNEYQELCLDESQKEQDFETNIIKEIQDYNHCLTENRLAFQSYRLSKELYRQCASKFAMGRSSVYDVLDAYKEQYSALRKMGETLQVLFKGYYTIRHAALYDFVMHKNMTDLILK